ncbi:non-ribosomal peptide synthetase [Ovoidimarina sediminis]|uniref:non-ribosomal peptide synthetase n=1 Tax=Ovoidimarina sediminis TaxID=3079856 RepID=UPI00292FE473|nr:non-ribosomal peptide synthetase [Rhodophyticola sp. MJ-SS7]
MAARKDSACLLTPDRAPLLFADLAAAITDVRSVLNDIGLGIGCRIAIVCEARPEAYVALQTVSPSATAAMIDARLTTSEYARIFGHIGAHAVIATSDHTPAREAAREAGLPVITLKPEPDAPAGRFSLDADRIGATAQAGPAGPDDLAYLLMSSGTTSRPKAVCIPHWLAVRRARSASQSIGLTPADIGLNFRPPHLGGGINIGFQSAVYSGGTVVVSQDFDPDDFFCLADTFRTTWFSGGPAYHRAILERAEDHRDIIARWDMRIVRAASYQLPETIRERLESELGLTCIVKYGSTDAGMIACETVDLPHRANSVGRPYQCEVRIVDDIGDVLRAGREGQIVVRNDEMAPGYYNDPEADAAFRNGWFYTGDLGRFDADGYLYVTGRKKLVINRGGQKISPLEVEAAIAEIDGVSDCACFALPHPTLGQIPAAVVAPVHETRLTEEAVVDALSKRLARYKLPDRIIVVDKVPRSYGGKFQPGQALEALGLGRPPQTEHDGTWSELERRLAEIWKPILNISELNLSDSFVVRGGDSLQALRLVLEIEDAFGVTLSTETIYGRGATIRGMAEAIDALKRAGTNVSANRHRRVEIPTREAGKEVPLTFAQERLWFVLKADPSALGYSVGHGIRFHGAVDMTRLRDAVQSLVDRHEILRARFPRRDGRPVQFFDAIERVEIPVTDLAVRSEDDAERKMNLAAQDFIAQSYDIETGPLFRPRFLKISEDDGVLVLGMNHIVTDGVSSEVMDKEILAHYHGEDRALPQPVPFGDYALWERDRLRGDRADRMLSYWKDALDGAPPVLSLPSDRPRPARAAYFGDRMRITLSGDLCNQLRNTAAEHQTTLFAAALAAFQALLFRTSMQDDLIVGTGVDGRPPGTSGRSIGLYVNVLPIRGRLVPDMSFGDLLAQSRKVLSDGLRHAEVPFERIVQAVNPPRTLACHPLVQAFFGLMPRRSSDIGSGDDLEALDLGRRFARFDLSFMLVEEVDGIGGFVEFRTDLFDRPTIARLIDMYQRLVGAMTQNPDLPISTHALTSDAQAAALVRSMCGKEADYPVDRSIHAVFRDVARRAPERPAVTGPDGTRIDYGTLDSWSDAIAHRLRDAGVRGGLVAVSAERRPAFVAGILGCLKAGTGYLPIAPDGPKSRLRDIIRDAGSTHVLLQAGSLLNVANTPLRVVDLPQNPIAPRADAGGLPDSAGHDDVAYVLFTSGSTGRPKGVAIHHGGILRLVINTDIADLGPDHAFLQIAPTTFDVSSFDIWGSLLNGGHVIQAPWPLPGLTELARQIENEEVTSVEITTPLFEKLVDVRASAFAGLHQVLVGGDAMSPDHARRFLASAPATRLVNAYGPTENSVWSTAHVVTSDSAKGHTIPIGRAIANTSVYILDARGAPVPHGIEGELAVGGPGVGLGYLNAPDLTAQKFRPDPFSDRPGARMYLTGDRARLCQNGEIEFRGRLDQQVKIRGFLVEPAEIVAALSDQPDIAQAHVIATDADDGQKRLLGFFAPSDPVAAGPSPNEVRRRLQELLPAYLVPSRLFQVSHLPLTRNGKIDRAKLLEVARSTREETVKRTPQTLIEATVGLLWKEVLSHDDYDREVSFFDAGGDSLLLMELAFKIVEEFGVELPLPLLFRDPSIAGIAKLIEDHGHEVERPGLVVGDPLVVPLVYRREADSEDRRLYIVSGAGGHVLPFAGIARNLMDEWTAVGLLDPAIGGELPRPTIEDVAARLIQAVESVDPDGPVFLAGYSFGGLVAHEMANQLHSSGRRVGVVLLDTRSPHLQTVSRRLYSELRQRKKWFADLAQDLRRTASDRTANFNEQEERRRRTGLRIHQRQLGQAYVPAAHDAPTVLLRSESGTGPLSLEDHGWGKVLPDIEVMHVKGTHLDMLKGKNEGGFSTVLSRALSRVEAASRSRASDR